MLGLPERITACLFDMDGVLTRTATLHAAAWAETFDDFLRHRAQQHGEPFVPFDRHRDYANYVDGKRRADGVRDFLASRSIRLPEGAADAEPGMTTVHGIANAKNAAIQGLIERRGADTYADSIDYVHRARAAGLATAVVSSSANTRRILRVAAIGDLFDVVVDGVVARELSLPGKPAPDTFLHAAGQLGAHPGNAAVFEDALSGVAAGRAGGFGYVIGVDRLGQAAELREHGADIVVTDLQQLQGAPHDGPRAAHLRGGEQPQPAATDESE